MKRHHTGKISGLILLILCIALPAMAQRMSVTSEVANIRSGPGLQYDVIWQVERYHPVKVIKKKGAWYQFKDFEGDRGWIHRSLLGKTPSLITNNDQCNVRSGPGTNHPVIFTVGKGIPFKVLKRNGHWVYLKHADGDKGWIHDSLLW